MGQLYKWLLKLNYWCFFKKWNFILSALFINWSFLIKHRFILFKFHFIQKLGPKCVWYLCYCLCHQWSHQPQSEFVVDRPEPITRFWWTVFMFAYLNLSLCVTVDSVRTQETHRLIMYINLKWWGSASYSCTGCLSGSSSKGSTFLGLRCVPYQVIQKLDWAVDEETRPAPSVDPTILANETLPWVTLSVKMDKLKLEVLKTKTY